MTFLQQSYKSNGLGRSPIGFAVLCHWRFVLAIFGDEKIKSNCRISYRFSGWSTVLGDALLNELVIFIFISEEIGCISDVIHKRSKQLNLE